MEPPAWARKIFENEFDLETDADPMREAEDWLDEFVVGDTFEEFYDEQVSKAPETRYSAGQNRAYSIRDPPFNCEGKAAAGALAGELVFDRDLELLVEWNLGRPRGNPHRQSGYRQPTTFNGHVALVDDEGNTYGGTGLMDSPEREPIEKTAGIYLANMADKARFNDNREEPEHYLDQINLDIRSQYAGARKRMIEGSG